MSDPAEATPDTEPRTEPYQPFPSFLDWAKIPVNETLFRSFESQLQQARTDAGEEVSDAIIEQATRSAAVDTGALEGIFETDRGFTYSVAVGATIADIAKLKGEVAARAIADAINGYEYVLSAATRSDNITEVWIRELHSTICASQETVITSLGPQEQALPKGEYKKQKNNPLHIPTEVIHSYASVEDTAPEMARLVQEMRTPEFEAAHASAQAAYAHYAFVSVHPFSDGNGRVARALASVFLYRRFGIPLVIYVDQKGTYLDSLEAADAGEIEKFQDFINFRVLDTLASVRQDIRAAAAPSIAKQLEQLAILQTGRGGLTHAELDGLGGYLLESLRQSFAEQVPLQMMTSPLTTQVVLQQGNSGQAIPAGYRSIIPTPQFLNVFISSAAPAAAQAQRLYDVAIAKSGVDGPDFYIVGSGNVIMEAFIRDVSPAPSASFQHRVEQLATAELSSALSQILSQAAQSLGETGYGA